MLHNQKRFNPDLFHQDSIIEEAKLVWVPINSQWNQMIPYRIQRANVFLQDEAVDLDDLTLHQDSSIFKLVKMTNLPYEKDRNV